MLNSSIAIDVQDMFQRHFTAEEQHALLRLLPKADQQAASACAGHNPLASTHLKAAAATYLQASHHSCLTL